VTQTRAITPDRVVAVAALVLAVRPLGLFGRPA